MCYYIDCFSILFNQKNQRIKFTNLCKRCNDFVLCLCNLFWLTSIVLPRFSSESELQNSGVELSSSAIATIERYGHTADMGPVSLAPDLPSIVIWATIGFMFIGGIWFKYPDQKQFLKTFHIRRVFCLHLIFINILIFR